ncbi:unnamed protein product [Rotaria sordida]|uniref:Uncharacterized protein n=2 Tax=Rotaria sordida TaxID=392033 RepID=A0A816FH66_9BILA|nr:unnamed protein product [Rotaria sordida]CAF1661435.1 unnamed protein product [Rotaria sordida]
MDNMTYNQRFGNVCKHADYIRDYTADLDNNLWCRLTMVFPATQPDRLKNNILTYINRFIETFDENVYMKIHLQC